MSKKKKQQEEENFMDVMPEMSFNLPFTQMNYALDLDAICDFINYADKHETREIVITDAEAKNVPLSYDGENGGDLDEMRKDMKTKEVREAKGHTNQQMDTLRYDLIKLMIDYVMTPTSNDSGNEFDNVHSLFGYMTAFNTLRKHNMLVRYEDPDADVDEDDTYYND